MTATQVQQLASILDQLAALLLPLALSWALAHWAWLKRAEATLARRDLVGQLARTAVRAAEQALSGQEGAARKQYALSWLERAAEQHGVRVTPAQLETFSGAIEAAVREMHAGDEVRAGVVKPAAPPAPPATDESAASGAGYPAARTAATPQGGATT